MAKKKAKKKAKARKRLSRKDKETILGLTNVKQKIKVATEKIAYWRDKLREAIEYADMLIDNSETAIEDLEAAKDLVENAADKISETV